MSSIEPTALTWSQTAPQAVPKETIYGDERTQAIINRCLRGDELGYVALYDQYATMIYRLNYSMLQHKEDAEEVLQDSFEYAFRKLSQYDANKSSFKTWLYQIAISRCRNKRRRKWRPTFSLNQLSGPDLTDTETLTPDDVMHLTDKQRIIWKALHKLSTKLRETAVLRYYEGLTYAEIGNILGIPEKTVESRMRLAHKGLRKLLKESDFE